MKKAAKSPGRHQVLLDPDRCQKYNVAVTIRSARSFLFVPADEPKLVAKAARAGADAVILDLEDSVAGTHKSEAREIAERILRERPGSSLWLVRVRTSAEVTRAAAVIEAYERAVAAGAGTVQYEGAMVDRPLVQQARGIIERAARVT